MFSIEFINMNPTNIIILYLCACIGSFLNVVIHRYYSKESVVFGSSYCPSCNEKIKWFDNIPIFSWIFLKGKCRFCSEEIPISYFLVESFSAYVGFYLFFLNDSFFISKMKNSWGLELTILSFFLFSLFLIITIIDLRSKIIPTRFLLMSGLVIFLMHFFTENPSKSLQDGFIGMVLVAGSLALILRIGTFIMKQDAMGWGDVNMAFVIGFLLGVDYGFFAIAIAIFSGAVFGSGMMLYKRLKNENYRNLEMPFGPFLAIGTFITFLKGMSSMPFLANFFYGS